MLELAERNQDKQEQTSPISNQQDAVKCIDLDWIQISIVSVQQPTLYLTASLLTEQYCKDATCMHQQSLYAFL
jgi:hypothetical protein